MEADNTKPAAPKAPAKKAAPKAAPKAEKQGIQYPGGTTRYDR